MKITLTTSQIARRIVEDCGFEYESAKALAEWYEALEEDTGEEIEYDGTAIRCEWYEYESLDAYMQENYPADYENWKNSSKEEQLEWFTDQTTVIQVNENAVLIYAF